MKSLRAISVTFVLACAGLSIASTAGLAGEEILSNCQISTDRDACLVRAIGADRAEWHAKNGYNLIRVIEWNAFGGVEAFIDAVETPTGFWLVVRNGGGGQIALPISQTDWTVFVDGWRKFAAGGYAIPTPDPRPRPGAPETVIVCTDSWSATIETALDGKVARRSTSSCENKDGEYDLASDLYARAVALVPFCTLLKEPGRILQQCLRLEGDKYEAADLANASAPFWGSFCYHKDGADRITPLFADTAILKIAGQPDVSGKMQAVHALSAFLCEKRRYLQYDMFYGSLDGGDIRGTVGMTLDRDKADANDGSLAYYSAPLDIAWRRAKDGALQIESLNIGAFVESR